MSNIKVDSENVLIAYKNADDKGKKLLKDLYGDQVDFNQNIMDRVKTFEDACAVLKIDPATVLVAARHEDTKSINAYAKLIIIIRALNEGWVPDWADTNTYKYYAWFIHKTGVGLSYYGDVSASSGTHFGSRLVFKSMELAAYAGKQFEDIYRDYLTL